MVLYIIFKLICIENLAYSTLNHQNPSRTALDMTVYVLPACYPVKYSLGVGVATSSPPRPLYITDD